MSRSGNAVVLFAALGDATRLSLLRRLSVDGPLSITRLSEGTGVTRQAITRHLDALGRVGLVRDARRGRERVFELDAKRLEIAPRRSGTPRRRDSRLLWRGELTAPSASPTPPGISRPRP